MKKFFSPTKKKAFVGGGYTMENKNTKTDYQEVNRIENQK